jgi:predicted nucleic acid-binding protein
VIRTFLDSGVLIAASRAAGVLGTRALALFNDSDRVFVTSEFVRMEIFPKAIYYKRQSEVEFYEDFFADAEHIVPISESLGHLAYTEACHAGLSGLDALHIAAAKFSGAEEFITTERPTKPLFRVIGILITSIALP